MRDEKLAARLLRRADILIDRGRFGDALEACRQALEADQGRTDLYRRIGALCVLLKQPQAACNALEIALEFDPYDADALCNMGVALRELGQLHDAQRRLELAIRLDPALASGWFNLGLIQADMARWDDAIASQLRALAAAPGHVKAAGALSSALLAAGRAEEAATVARQALVMVPGMAELHICLASALLTQGALAEGWREAEWRWKIPALAAAHRHGGIPAWNGEPPTGRRLLLHAEQGYGDTLQMCRYLPLIRGAGSIVFEVPAPLLRLFRTVPSPLGTPVELVAQGTAIGDTDLQCPTMSLPYVCGTAVAADVPNTVPYLHACADDIATWQHRLRAAQGLRVGLCWGSGMRADLVSRIVQARKSIPLSCLAPLATVPGISFVSLQTGPAAADLRTPPEGLAIEDFSGCIGDFADTAALICCLDLVVTVDTAIAHLAGALGAPVWLLNRFDADWRWSRAQDVAPWYPTLLQVRQPEPGAWGAVVRAVVEMLMERTGSAYQAESKSPSRI